MRIEIDVTTRSAAPAERVFALIADASSWPRWAGVDDATVEQGAGVGEIRAFRSGEVTTRERVTVVEPSYRFGTTLLSGLPVAEHEAEVTLSVLHGRGTKIRWRVRCTPALPEAAMLVRTQLERVIATAADGLAREAAAAGAA